VDNYIRESQIYSGHKFKMMEFVPYNQYEATWIEGSDLKNYAIDHLLYRSGNKLVDNFIRNAQIYGNLDINMMEFVPYVQFKDVEYIFKFESYKATWIVGNIQSWNKKEINFKRNGLMTVVLKKLTDELNEVHII